MPRYEVTVERSNGTVPWNEATLRRLATVTSRTTPWQILSRMVSGTPDHFEVRMWTKQLDTILSSPAPEDPVWVEARRRLIEGCLSAGCTTSERTWRSESESAK